MANRYFINIGANWGDTANWSDTSGGTGGFSVPTNVDDVFFDANSGNCTVNASARTAKTLNFTGYTNTITMSNGITVSGNVTLSATMTVSGTAALTVNATSTITSNTKTWSAGLSFSNTITVTLADDLNVTGTINMGSVVGYNTTMNGNNLILQDGSSITMNNVGFNASCSGTTTIKLLGTCSIINGGGGGGMTYNNPVIFDSGTKTITLNSGVGTIGFGSGGSVYTSGIVDTTNANAVSFPSGSHNTKGIIWKNITLINLTLLSDITAAGLVTLSPGATINGTFNINAYGGVSIASGIYVQGTGVTTLNLLGGTLIGGGTIRINTIINGNISISGTIGYNTGTITYLSGKVNCLVGSLFFIGTGTFINMDKINFRTVTITAGATITMNKFFSGSALMPTRIQSTGANYTIAFQDGFEKITKFTKISNCTVSRPGQLLCLTDNSNKGGNVGVRYINQMPNGVPKNAPSINNPLGYSIPSFLDSDPNFIIK